MPRKAQAKLPAEVKRLQERVERWRRTRARRTAMPAELWTDAVTVAKSAGAYRVTRALRINFEGLKRRMAEAGVVGTAPGERADGFIELTGAQILGGTSGTVVEVEDESGMRLVVRLGREAHLDVAALVSAFRRRGG